MRKLIFMVVLAGSPALADVGKPIVKAMPFEACLATIQQMAQSMGEAPTNIVETRDTRIVRLSASDGSLLVTCSREKGTMTLTPSSHKCGVDVAC